jgi:hypothetical protein
MASFIFFALILAVVIVGVVYANQLEQRALEQTLREVAAKYQGTVYSGGWDDPHANVILDGRAALLQFVHVGKNDHRTRLTLPWTADDLRLELRPATVLDNLGRFIGFQDIEIGSPDFDARYLITGNNPQRICEFLSPAVQEVLGVLGRLSAWNDGVHLEIGGGQMRITCSNRLKEKSKLLAFISAAERLIELARSIGAEGITFLSTSHADLAERPHCLVCGEGLAGQLVSCSRCKTLHHRDCWDYSGGCATYACGCKTPRAAGGQRRAG